MPKTLYNVLINRGPGSKCSLFLSTTKNLDLMNSVGITYNKTTKKWDAFISLSEEEFDLYQQSLLH